MTAKLPDEPFYRIIQHVSEGGSVKDMTVGPNSLMHRSVFFDRVKQDAEMERAYRLAQQQSADALMERIDEIMRKVEAGEMDSRAARTLINHLEWRAERANPQRYGQRVTTEVTEGKPSYIEALQKAQPKIQEAATARPVVVGGGGGGPVKEAS